MKKSLEDIFEDEEVDQGWMALYKDAEHQDMPIPTTSGSLTVSRRRIGPNRSPCALETVSQEAD
jgi:hypothetical protein